MKWQSMGGRYSSNELASMQKDAMERVREMQRRADETLRRSNASLMPPPKTEAPKPAPLPLTETPKPSPPSSPLPNTNGKIGTVLSAAGIDQDRMIILALLLILYNDGADNLILLALLYLFL